MQQTIPASSPCWRSSASSSSGSTKSSWRGHKLHWFLHDTDTSICEEDLKREQDYIYRLCIEAVKDIETETLEQVRRAEKSTSVRIYEAISQAQKELKESMLLEQTQQDTTLAEIRRDIGVQRDIQNQLMAAEAAMAQLQGELHAVHELQEFQAEAGKVVDAALADLSSELQLNCEKQELHAETTQMALADFKHDLSTLQLAQVHGLQDQALQILSDVSRNIQEGQGALRADLQQMVNAIRGELEQVGCISACHLVRTEALEATTQAQEVRNQELTDRIAETERWVAAFVEEFGEFAAGSGNVSRTAGRSQPGTLLQAAAKEGADSMSPGSGPKLLGGPPRPTTAHAAGTPCPAGDPTGALPRQQIPTGGPGLEDSRERAAVLARMEVVESLCLGLARKADRAEESDTAAHVHSIAELQSALSAASGSIEHLKRDLAQEQAERLRSLASMDRSTKDLRLNSVHAGTSALQFRMESERANAELGERICRLEAALLCPRLDKPEERLGSVALMCASACKKPDSSAQAVSTIDVMEQAGGKGDPGDDNDFFLQARSARAHPLAPEPGAKVRDHDEGPEDSTTEPPLHHAHAEPAEKHDKASVRACHPATARAELLPAQQNAAGQLAPGSASSVSCREMTPRRARAPAAEARSPSRRVTVLSVTPVTHQSGRDPVLHQGDDRAVAGERARCRAPSRRSQVHAADAISASLSGSAF